MSAATVLRRTPLYGLQAELGAKFVDFHGWDLPVQFSSILKEHHAVRAACGLFDVSHMGQIMVSGRRALDLIEQTNSNHAGRLKPGEAMYSHMLNERGCVIDDVIVSRLGSERFLVVVNAATADKDFAWLKAHGVGMALELADLSSDFGMLAVQGPQAHAIMGSVIPNASALARFGALEIDLYGHQIFVTRTGYTGEDGFEIIAPNAIAPRVWENLMARGGPLGILPCGLGARDTLRLEAGYLLYGSDIDDDHTSLEAGYGWVVKFHKGNFIGREALDRQRREGLNRRLLGVKLLERGVPRPQAQALFNGQAVGRLTSATFSPTLQTGIGMGYINRTDLLIGDQVTVEIHGRAVGARIVEMPFYKRKSGE